eukprot:c12132_g3_i1 orf=2-2467(-)
MQTLIQAMEPSTLVSPSHDFTTGGGNSLLTQYISMDQRVSGQILRHESPRNCLCQRSASDLCSCSEQRTENKELCEMLYNDEVINAIAGKMELSISDREAIDTIVGKMEFSIPDSEAINTIAGKMEHSISDGVLCKEDQALCDMLYNDEAINAVKKMDFSVSDNPLSIDFSKRLAEETAADVSDGPLCNEAMKRLAGEIDAEVSDGFFCDEVNGADAENPPYVKGNKRLAGEMEARVSVGFLCNEGNGRLAGDMDDFYDEGNEGLIRSMQLDIFDSLLCDERKGKFICNVTVDDCSMDKKSRGKARANKEETSDSSLDETLTKKKLKLVANAVVSDGFLSNESKEISSHRNMEAKSPESLPLNTTMSGSHDISDYHVCKGKMTCSAKAEGILCKDCKQKILKAAVDSRNDTLCKSMDGKLERCHERDEKLSDCKEANERPAADMVIDMSVRRHNNVAKRKSISSLKADIRGGNNMKSISVSLVKANIDKDTSGNKLLNSCKRATENHPVHEKHDSKADRGVDKELEIDTPEDFSGKQAKKRLKCQIKPDMLHRRACGNVCSPKRPFENEVSGKMYSNTVDKRFSKVEVSGDVCHKKFVGKPDILMENRALFRKHHNEGKKRVLKEMELDKPNDILSKSSNKEMELDKPDHVFSKSSDAKLNERQMETKGFFKKPDKEAKIVSTSKRADILNDPIYKRLSGKLLKCHGAHPGLAGDDNTLQEARWKGMEVVQSKESMEKQQNDRKTSSLGEMDADIPVNLCCKRSNAKVCMCSKLAMENKALFKKLYTGVKKRPADVIAAASLTKKGKTEGHELSRSSEITSK